MARAKVNQDINLDEYQDIWVIGEQREGKLHPVTLELIGEGRKLADDQGCKRTSWIRCLRSRPGWGRGFLSHVTVHESV